MPSFALPTPGVANQPFQFATIPQMGATPPKLFLKNTTAAYVYDGTSLTKVTDADYPALTVPGVAYLDGTIYVMKSDGAIYGSDLLTPGTWTALNFISANAEGDRAVALARHLQYIVAFKERSTEIFYDAGNPVPGSPLSKMPSGLMEVGCAAAGSIAYTDNSLFFMSSSYPKGRSVQMMEGFTPRKVSTPFIDRLLDADTLSKVFSFVVKSNGHTFYVLTLVNTNLTLVYDAITNEWHRWTHLTRGADVAATTSTSSYGVTTFTVSGGHGLNDGDPILILGDVLPISYISSTQFSITSAQLIPPSTVYTSYTEGYFPGVFYTRGSNVDLLLSENGAVVYEFSTSVFQDAGLPINFKARTALDDWGVMATKFFRRLEIVGDIEDTTLQVRTSDDDYRTWSNYRKIQLTNDRAQLKALGAGRRRAHEIRHFDNTPLRLVSLEVDFDLGAR